MNPTTKRKYRRFKKVVKNPIKLTALYYLRESLMKENYEQCAEIIGIAKEFGASPFEIQLLLEDPYRFPS